MTDTKNWIRGIRGVQPPELWEEIELRAGRGATIPEHRPGRPLLGAAVFFVAFALVGSLLYALRPLSGGAPVNPLAPGQIVRYRLDGAPQPLAVGEGAAWVDVTTMSERGTGPSTIWRIDAKTGETKRLPQTIGAVWVAAGPEGVWATCDVTSCGGRGLIQLDPATGDLVREVALSGRPSQIALGMGAVWVTTDGGLVKVNPVRGEVVATFPGSDNLIGVSDTAVWVTTARGVAQIDPSTGIVANHFPFPDPCNLEVSVNTVFVATCGGATIHHDALEAIDARTSQLLYRVPRESYGPMRVWGNTLIIAEHDPADQGYIRLVGLDAATGQPSGPPFSVKRGESRFYTLSMFPPNPFLGVGEGSAWFSDFSAGEVVRVGLPLRGTGVPAPSPTGPTVSPSSIEDAKATALDESKRLIGLVRVPPGSTSATSAPVPGLAKPAQSPATNYLLDEHAWWNVPLSASSANAWLNAHPPARLRQSLNGSGVGVGGAFDYIGYEDDPSNAYSSATLLIEVISTGAGTSAIRADGQTVWLPPRPDDTLVPDDVAQASAVAYRGSPSNVIAERTLRGSGALKLATVFNELHVDNRGVHGCLNDSGLRYQVTFSTPAGPLVFTDDPACSSVSASLNGASVTALQDDAGVSRELQRILPKDGSTGSVAASSLCSSSDLRLGQGPQISEATGQNSRLLTLTNVSSTTCHLRGYPTIVLHDASGQPIPFRYRYRGDQMVTSGHPVLVTLAAGSKAYVMFNKYRCDAGDQGRARSVSVTPPGSASALRLSLAASPDLGYCGPGDPGTFVEVSPIESTAAATLAH